MEAFLVHNMAPIMFAALVVFLLLGYPVAFSLAANGLFFAVIGIELGLFPPDFLQALPERVYGVMNNDTLLAIPFFTFMGLILERSGMAEDLLDTIGQLFGPIRGGLAYAVIFVGALLAATTGVVAASVISMGLISLPIMLRYGYDRRLASGVIAASGTLAQIIPPSLVLIVMADQLGRSVGDMYEAAFIPGMVLSLLYAGYVFLVTIFYPGAAPALPLSARTLGSGVTSLLVLLGTTVAVGILVRYITVPSAEALAAAGDQSSPIVTAVVAGLFAYVLALANKFHGWRTGLLLVLAGLACAAFAAVLASAVPPPEVAPAVVADASAVEAVLTYVGATLRVVTPYLAGFLLLAGAAFLAFRLYYQATGAAPLSRLAQEVVLVLMPPLALIFLVLGTIFIGLATPTEGGAMGAAGALLLALLKRRLSFGLLKQAMESTTKLSAFVIFILIGARVFSLTFYGVNGHKWVEELLVALPGGEVGFLIVVNIMVFLLAFFLDFFELAFIIVPLLGPAAERLGIDLIWFGVILSVNMQTSFMHPPFGFALFYLRSVAARVPYLDKITGKRMEPVTTGQIYWGAVPFVVIQVVMVLLVIFFPAMVMHYKGAGTGIDPSTIQQLDLPQLDDLPELDFGAPPGLEGPPAGLDGPPPGLTPSPDLAPPEPPVIPPPSGAGG